MLVVSLNTTQSILVVSGVGGDSATMSISDETITTSAGVWTKESNSAFDEEW